MDSAGDFVVAWDSDAQDGSSFGVYAQRYNLAGESRGGEFHVNTYTTGVQNHSTISMDSAGEFLIAWDSGGSIFSIQDGDGYGVYAQRYWPLLGDTNHDGAVDVDDYNNVQNHFRQTGSPVAGDTDGNGAVDLDDYDNVQNHFNEHATALASSNPAAGAAAAIRPLAVGDLISTDQNSLESSQPNLFGSGVSDNSIGAAGTQNNAAAATVCAAVIPTVDRTPQPSFTIQSALVGGQPAMLRAQSSGARAPQVVQAWKYVRLAIDKSDQLDDDLINLLVTKRPLRGTR